MRWLAEASRLFLARIGLWTGAAFFLVVLANLLTLFVILAIGSSSGGSSSSGHSSIAWWQIALVWDLLALPCFLGVAAAFSGGVYGVAARQVRGETTAFRDLFRPRFAARLFGFSLLHNTLIFFGLLFLFVPALVFAAFLLPAPTLIANGSGVFEAILTSVGAMTKAWGRATGLMLIVGVLLALSVLPCLLGLVVSLPIFWLLSPLAARDLVERPAAGDAEPDYGVAQEGVWPPPPRRF